MTDAVAAGACSLAVGYVLGGFLTADVVCRRRLGKSAFDVGTGNPGMANVGARLGVGAAALVLAGDIGKTVLAAALSCLLWGGLTGTPGELFAGHPAALLAGLGATLGHDFPLWHRLRGGKGVTTTCSAIILFRPLVGGGCCLAGLAVVALTSQLCYGAVAIPALFVVAELVAGDGAAGVAGAAALLALALAEHGGPCLRALRGEEPKTRLFHRG